MTTTHPTDASPEDDILKSIIHLTLPQKNHGELSVLWASMAKIVLNLQQQNKDLITEVGLLRKEIVDLKNSVDTSGTSNKKTFAEILSKGLAAPSAQVSFMSAAKLAQDADSRKCAVIVRNAQVSSDSSKDADFAKEIADQCKVSGKCQVFRINLKENAPPLLKLQLQSKEDAFKILTTFEKMKGNLNGCRNASVRPDFSKPELAKYRQAWKEVIKLNNEAKQRLFTVRNLEVSRIPYKKDQTPWPWTIQQNK